MKRIPLTQGKFALVDDEEFGWLSKYKWYAAFNCQTFYAKRATANLYRNRSNQRPQIFILMHRQIMNIDIGSQIDHRDGNGLNNQKSNLRFATSQQQCRNRTRKPINTSSIYKGVYWNKYMKKWRAKIVINKKEIHLGYFQDEIKAAKAYDEKAVELFGEFARGNNV